MGELSEATNRDRPTEPMAVMALREGQCCAPARTNYRSTTLRPAGESPRRLRAMRQVVRAASTGIDSKILIRSEEHTSELQSQSNLVCRLLLEKKKSRMLLTPHLHRTID